jgi:hypothetical protein
VVCTDVTTGAPVEGLGVLVTANSLYDFDTDADGRVAVEDVGAGTVAVRVETGSGGPLYHGYEQTLVVDDDTTIDIPMLPVIDVDSPVHDNAFEIVLDALVTAGSSKLLKKWASYPIQWSVPSFTNVHGLDYTALTRQAAAQWNTRTGLAIFEEVPSSPTVGVHVEYQPRSVMGVQNGLTSYQNDVNGYPLHDRIRIVDDFSDGPKLYTILMHELGHTIRLSHLPSGFVMFGGQPLPADITDDEVRAVRLMLAIPNGTDLNRYDSDRPTP